MEATSPLLFSTLRDLKTSPLSKESETLSECTDQLFVSTTTRDSSTLASSTTPHGLSSPLTRDLLSKKSEEVTVEVQMSLLPSHSQASTTLSRSTRQLCSKTWGNGLPSTSPSTTWSQETCSFPFPRPLPKRAILMSPARSYRSSKWTSTPMSSSWETSPGKLGTASHSNLSSLIWDRVKLSELDLLLMMKHHHQRRFWTWAITQTLSLSSAHQNLPKKLNQR